VETLLMSENFAKIKLLLNRWAHYAISLLSFCPFRFVFATPPKPCGGFYRNFLQIARGLCNFFLKEIGLGGYLSVRAI
jgi:hypothetical protein